MSKLRTPLTELIGIEHPVVQTGMGWVAGARLVSATSNAGGLGILASAFHLANGFWTAAITWGLTISANAQRRWGAVCVGIFCFAFACGMLAVFSAILA